MLSQDRFQFRDIHPNIFMGTASDRYAGWIGQIYSEGHYKISSRSKIVGGKSFKEEAAQSWFYLGNAFYYKKEYLEASEAYRRSTELGQKLITAWFNWGVALGELDMKEEALKKFRKAKELAQNSR